MRRTRTILTLCVALVTGLATRTMVGQSSGQAPSDEYSQHVLPVLARFSFQLRRRLAPRGALCC